MVAEVTLRDVQEGDVPIFYLHQADSVASELAGVPSRDESDFDQHWAKILADASVLKKTILHGDEVAGFAVCFDRDGERQVGYWIGRDYWGRGIVSAALPRFLAQESHRPLRAHVSRKNSASVRLLEKNGFTRIEERVATVRGVVAAEYVYELK